MKLIDPSIEHETEFKLMLTEWETNKEEIVPPLFFDTNNDFKQYIELINKARIKSPSNFVNHSTFWLTTDGKRVLGTVNIRHELTEHLKIIGGHIGYGIRPSERNKGYGKRILTLALEKAKLIGIKRALITCDKDNYASIKVIESNGGILHSEDTYQGTKILRYWVHLYS